MSESIDELQKVLELSLEGLEEEKNAYIQIDNDLKSLMTLPQTASKLSKNNRLVCIGCDLWVEMSSSESTAYFNRRIDANQACLRQISEKIQQSRLILENIQTLLAQPSQNEPSEESNSDGLPIIDIQETLDDDGEVVSVTLNDKSIDTSEKESENLRISSDANKNLSTSDNIGASKASLEDETSDKDQIEELLADMEIVQKLTSGPKSKAIDENTEVKIPQSQAQDFDSDSDSDDYCPAIRPEDVLELELIASELSPEDERSDLLEDQEFDFELDEDDEEDDGEEDSAKADELLYGGNFGMFKGKADLQNRLWGEVQALRNKRLSKEDPKVFDESTSKAKTKLVRFSENTEVKEIEDVSESLKKIEHKKEKPLRFRERLIMSGKSEMRSPKIPKPTGSDEVTTDIIDRSDIS